MDDCFRGLAMADDRFLYLLFAKLACKVYIYCGVQMCQAIPTTCGHYVHKLMEAKLCIVRVVITYNWH